MAGHAVTRKLTREEAEQQQADREAEEKASLDYSAAFDADLAGVARPSPAPANELRGNELRDLSRAVVALVELSEQRPSRAGALALRAVRRGLAASIAVLVEDLATRGHAERLRPIVAALVRRPRR
jgi:hypothetical protein